jgi:hypothetical protein
MSTIQGAYRTSMVLLGFQLVSEIIHERALEVLLYQ